MCGIVCAIAQRNITNILLKGLSFLEYRGYDSSGIAVINENKKLHRIREVGKVKKLIKKVKNSHLIGNIGIAHTRWATHGIPSKKNAHPHISENIVIVHNGVIENHNILRTHLQKKGYIFHSNTDTEVIAHLINSEQKTRKFLSLKEILYIISKLKGVYSLVIMNSLDPKRLIGICYGSPLIIGCGKKENLISSDQIAILPVTKKLIFLEIGDVFEITTNNIIIIDKNGNVVKRCIVKSNIKNNKITKNGYKYYMHKEIHEQPIVIQKTLSNYLHNNTVYFNNLDDKINIIFKKMQNIKIVACGTSYHAGIVAKYWFEKFTRTTCEVEIASEFNYRNPAINKNSLLILLSQSGETADVISALRLSKKLNFISSLVICNVLTSVLVRESEMALITQAGIEISVASTKSFTTQLTLLLLLVEKLRKIKNINTVKKYNIIHELKLLPHRIEEILFQENFIKKIAKDFHNKKNVLFVARGDQYPIAMEGALKLKEISYIYAEAYAAGELKHGTLALIDSTLPIIVLAPNNKLLSKLQANIEEIYSRGGILYIFSEKNLFFEKKRIKVIPLPKVENIISPIFYTVALQLFAYYVALIKKKDIDKPRNLAKSVTVE